MTEAEAVAAYLEAAGRCAVVLWRPGVVAYTTLGYVRATGADGQIRWKLTPTGLLLPEAAAAASEAADMECLERGRAMLYLAPWAPHPGEWCEVRRVPLQSGLIVATLRRVTDEELVPLARRWVAERCGIYPAAALTDAQLVTYLRTSSHQLTEGPATRSDLLHAGAPSARTVSRHLAALASLGVSGRAGSPGRVELERPIRRLPIENDSQLG